VVEKLLPPPPSACWLLAAASAAVLSITSDVRLTRNASTEKSSLKYSGFMLSAVLYA
jgi:hypothetical protein